MMDQSRIYPICVFCIWVLVPSTLYAMIANMYLISSGRTDSVIRPNSALLLTTSFLSLTFIISWMLAIGNNLSRMPPPSGKKAAFTFLVISTIFWFASVWTGVDVAVHRLVCREGANSLEGPAPWSDGLSCRMHRVGVAFSAFGLISSLILLSSMIEISDRAFGGISSTAKLHWTTEKFREALIEISEMSDDTCERGSHCSRSTHCNAHSSASSTTTITDEDSMQSTFGNRGRSRGGGGSTMPSTPASITPPPPAVVMDGRMTPPYSQFEWEAVGRAVLAENGNGNGNNGGGYGYPGMGEKRMSAGGADVVVVDLDMEKRLSRKARPRSK